jgi:hypothetical protein
VIAYGHLMNALMNGITYFDELVQYFKDNYDVLAPEYIKQKKLPIDIKAETK